ncbi:hypothetical protein AMECASPLE_023092 [Ameca splendens]|uniref:Uncharacterized protein n=1 Tax=Ameca splendens TaxID=208324 RepID=A0ABV0YQX8_9TELE
MLQYLPDNTTFPVLVADPPLISMRTRRHPTRTGRFWCFMALKQHKGSFVVEGKLSEHPAEVNAVSVCSNVPNIRCELNLRPADEPGTSCLSRTHLTTGPQLAAGRKLDS